MKNKPGMKTGSTRYYSVNSDGTHNRYVCAPGEIPEAHWIRGFPPRTEEYTKHFAELMNRVHSGKPKSEEQREKMRLRKLGVPKSEEHKTAMSITHQQRIPRIELVMKYNPHLNYYEASALEAKLRKSHERPIWYDEFLRTQTTR